MAGLSLMSPNMNVIKSVVFQNIALAEQECMHFQQLHWMRRLSKHTCMFSFLQASMSIHCIEVDRPSPFRSNSQPGLFLPWPTRILVILSNTVFAETATEFVWGITLFSACEGVARATKQRVNNIMTNNQQHMQECLCFQNHACSACKACVTDMQPSSKIALQLHACGTCFVKQTVKS